MRGGRKQKHFNNEEALEPETIKDVQDLLAGRVPSVKVKHHRVISGIMFLEADVLNGLIWDDWCFLIAGENPKDHGCVVATRLHTDKVTGARNGIAETTHGKQLNDTEGGIKYTKWCSSLQFQRGLTPTGRQSPTVTRIEQAREIFSRQLLELFKEPGSFKNQNWQRVQVCHVVVLDELLLIKSRASLTTIKTCYISTVTLVYLRGFSRSNATASIVPVDKYRTATPGQNLSLSLETSLNPSLSPSPDRETMMNLDQTTTIVLATMTISMMITDLMEDLASASLIQTSRTNAEARIASGLSSKSKMKSLLALLSSITTTVITIKISWT
jgi:hypothetical protein